MCKCDMKPQIRFKRLHNWVELPAYQTPGAAGFDLAASQRVVVHPGDTVTAPTGLACELPEGYELQIRARSSLALSGLMIKNGVGTVDSDYRGEIKVILYNTEDYGAPVVINEGQRIAQGVLCRVPQAEIVEVEELAPTARGKGGFGSTGK